MKNFINAITACFVYCAISAVKIQGVAGECYKMYFYSCIRNGDMI